MEARFELLVVERADGAKRARVLIDRLPGEETFSVESRRGHKVEGENISRIRPMRRIGRVICIRDSGNRVFQDAKTGNGDANLIARVQGEFRRRDHAGAGQQVTSVGE
jgi:hypothetical protein